MRKICEVFYEVASTKLGGNREAWLHNIVIFKDNPGKKLIPHDKSESHKDAINSLKNLKIKDAFEKIDRITNREKNKANELYVPSNKSP